MIENISVKCTVKISKLKLFPMPWDELPEGFTKIIAIKFQQGKSTCVQDTRSLQFSETLQHYLKYFLWFMIKIQSFPLQNWVLKMQLFVSS